MASALDGAGLTPDRTVAEGFIDRSSRHEGIDHPLSPTLFFPVDSDLVVLDFALMNEFHELCLRLVTSGDGEIGNRRADLFEDYARSLLINTLGLREREMPVRPNMSVKEGGTDYGDVDFAFIRSGVLVHLDMKTWQRRPEYFRGDYTAVLNRQKTLEELNRKVQRREEKLVQLLAERGLRVNAIVDLLCVAEVEYVAPGTLWYGTLPKVLTPRTCPYAELVLALCSRTRRESRDRNAFRRSSTGTVPEAGGPAASRGSAANATGSSSSQPQSDATALALSDPRRAVDARMMRSLLKIAPPFSQVKCS